MDDKKDKNQYPQPHNPDMKPKTPDNAGLFEHLGVTDSHFLFQYKKTEKILAALYLVTNFLSNEEPLRWELRELGLNLLSNIMSLKDALPSQKDALCTAIKTTVLEMISMLEIAHFAGFISSMNFEVLKKEFVLLLESVSHTKQTLESFVLPNNFFSDEQVAPQAPQRQTDNALAPRVLGPSPVVKDKNNSPANKGHVPHKSPAKKDEPAQKAVYGSVLVKKTSRQNTIIDLLKKKKVIMIKDVSTLIHTCSEKTLQRELLAMVEQGILKKEGERRWSRYSLA